MRSRHLARRIFLAPAAGLALALAIAACSSSSSSPSASSSSPSAASTSGGTSSGSTAAIKANWEAFFSGSTSATKKVTLLQNGQAFATLIKSQVSLGSSTSATVTSVTLTSPTKATVKYNIVQGGTTVLPNQTGVAVYEDGTWKVGDTSFCALLALEGGGKAPPVCSSAS
jgi:hypothetical protein